MYLPGARFEVKLRIKLGDEEFEPGLKGTIIEGIPKMVGKAYKVEFDDGRIFLLRVIVADDVDPLLVVTVYRTSKIEKYWRQT